MLSKIICDETAHNQMNSSYKMNIYEFLTSSFTTTSDYCSIVLVFVVQFLDFILISFVLPSIPKKKKIFIYINAYISEAF